MFWGFLLITVSLSSLSFLPRFFWFQEISSSFGGYYLVVHLLTLLWLLFRLRKQSLVASAVAATALLLFSIFYAKALLPFYTSVPTVNSAGTPFSIFFVDGAESELNQEMLLSALDSRDPDVVGLSRFKIADPSALYKRYPFHLEAGASRGLIFLSKYPYSSEPVLAVGTDLPEVITAHLLVEEGKPVNVALLSVDAPFSKDAFYANRTLFRRVASEFRHRNDSAVVMGSFGVTPFSGLYGSFRYASEMENAANGFGLFRTYYSPNPLIRLPIDHIFVKGDLKVNSFEVLPSIGSTHLPIFSRMVLKSD